MQLKRENILIIFDIFWYFFENDIYFLGTLYLKTEELLELLGFLYV